MKKALLMFLVLPLFLSGCGKDNSDELHKTDETCKCCNCNTSFDIEGTVGSSSLTGRVFVWAPGSDRQEIGCATLAIPGADGIYLRIIWQCPDCNVQNSVQIKVK